MITEIMFELFMGVLTGFVSVFPAWAPPASLTGFGAQDGAAMQTIGGIFPVTTLGVCLLAIGATWLFVLTFQAIVFIYKLIPLKFT